MFDMLVKPAIPIPPLYINWCTDQILPSAILTQPKLCKSFKNSFLVNPVLPGFTLSTELRCPKCPYL